MYTMRLLQMPRLESCCLVLSLRTGNIIMGSLNALLSLVMSVVLVVAACDMESHKGVKEAEAAAAHDVALWLCIILGSIFLAKFCFDVFFIYGAVAERAGIIKAYFIMWVVVFLLSLFIFFEIGAGLRNEYICMEVVYIGLNVYIILLSYSFYKQLNSREKV